MSAYKRKLRRQFCAGLVCDLPEKCDLLNSCNWFSVRSASCSLLQYGYIVYQEKEKLVPQSTPMNGQRTGVYKLKVTITKWSITNKIMSILQLEHTLHTRYRALTARCENFNIEEEREEFCRPHPNRIWIITVGSFGDVMNLTSS